LYLLSSVADATQLYASEGASAALQHEDSTVVGVKYRVRRLGQLLPSNNPQLASLWLMGYKAGAERERPVATSA
jgi:hypothetical protein